MRRRLRQALAGAGCADRQACCHDAILFDPAIALLFQLEGEVFVAAVDDLAVGEHVDVVRDDGV